MAAAGAARIARFAGAEPAEEGEEDKGAWGRVRFADGSMGRALHGGVIGFGDGTPANPREYMVVGPKSETVVVGDRDADEDAREWVRETVSRIRADVEDAVVVQARLAWREALGAIRLDHDGDGGGDGGASIASAVTRITEVLDDESRGIRVVDGEWRCVGGDVFVASTATREFRRSAVVCGPHRFDVDGDVRSYTLRRLQVVDRVEDVSVEDLVKV
jgi:hypothetical protein